jgi:hypothetical protein
MWTVFTVLAVPAVFTFFGTFEPILPASVNKPMTESTSEQAAPAEAAETQEARDHRALTRISSFTTN